MKQNSGEISRENAKACLLCSVTSHFKQPSQSLTPTNQRAT